MSLWIILRDHKLIISRTITPRFPNSTLKSTICAVNCKYKFLHLNGIYETDHPFRHSSIDSVKPTLKKVSKYENKFAKLQKKAAEFNFRNQLKVVKKKEFTLEEEEKEVSDQQERWTSRRHRILIV